MGPAQWLAEAAPIPDEGPSAEEFLAAFRERTGQEPAYPAVQAFAAGLLALRCLRDEDEEQTTVPLGDVVTAVRTSLAR